MFLLEFYTVDTIYEHLEKTGYKKNKQDFMGFIVSYFKRVSADPDFTAFMDKLKRNDRSLDIKSSSLAIESIVTYEKQNIEKSPVVTLWNKFASHIREGAIAQQLKIKTRTELNSSKPVQHRISNDEYYELIYEKLFYASVLTFILYACFKRKEASFDCIVNAELPNMLTPEISKHRAEDLAKKHVEGIIKLLFKSYYDESRSSQQTNILLEDRKNIYTFTLLAIVYKYSCVKDKKYVGELNHYINILKSGLGSSEELDRIKERLIYHTSLLEKLIKKMPEFLQHSYNASELIQEWAKPAHYEKLYRNAKYFITGHTITSEASSLNKKYAEITCDDFPIRRKGQVQQESVMKAAKQFFSKGLMLLVATQNTKGQNRLRWKDEELKNPAFMYLHKIFVEEIHTQLNKRFLGEI
jgi:hypothetical protein